MKLGKFFSLILLGLHLVQPSFANSKASIFSFPSFIHVELPATGIAEANLFDRAILAAYQLDVRDPKNLDQELRANIRARFYVTEEQLEAAQVFMLKRGQVLISPDGFRKAKSELGFELKDVMRFKLFSTRFKAFAQARQIDFAVTSESNEIIDALAADFVHFTDQIGVHSHNTSKLINETAEALMPRDRARLLISFIKAQMNHMTVARNMKLNVTRAEAGNRAAELLKPLLYDFKDMAQFMLEELTDMSMTIEVEYFEPLQILIEPLKVYAAQNNRQMTLASVTEKTIEQFRSTGYINDIPYVYGSGDRIKIYKERYALDMSLRSQAEQSRLAADNIKTVLRSSAKNIEEIVRRDQLLAFILNYVAPEEMPALVNSLLLRNQPGEVVSLGFLAPLVRKLEAVGNDKLDPVFAAISSDTKESASFEQIDFMIELVGHRTDVSLFMKQVLRKKLRRKMISGVFLSSAVDIHRISKEIERYRLLVTRSEFLELMNETAQASADMVQNETVFMGDVTKWRHVVDARLARSPIFALMTRYIYASGGDLTATTETCNQLLYGDVDELAQTRYQADSKVLLFKR